MWPSVVEGETPFSKDYTGLERSWQEGQGQPGMSLKAEKAREAADTCHSRGSGEGLEQGAWRGDGLVRSGPLR